VSPISALENGALVSSSNVTLSYGCAQCSKWNAVTKMEKDGNGYSRPIYVLISAGMEFRNKK
jgi:hypothetical protein